MKTQKIIFLVGAFFLLNSSVYSQIWYFGNNGGIDISGVETAVAGGQINTQEGVAVQTDVNGDLMFYTDGLTVWDDTHTPFAGPALNGAVSMAQVLTCPKPGTAGEEYFIFYGIPGNAVVGANLKYSIVDAITKTVLNADNSLAGAMFYEGMVVVQHSNGTDYWLLTHAAQAGAGTNQFHSWLITAGGLAYSGMSSAGDNFAYNSSNVGYMAVSKANDRIAVTHAANGRVQVFNFNNTTGSVTGLVRSRSPGSWTYGCAFSPDGNYLYYTRRSVFLRQLNIGTGAFTDISTVAGNGGVWMGAVQRAANDKIYVSMVNQNDIGVLNTPNGWGAGAAGWDQTAIGGAGMGADIAKDGLPSEPFEVYLPPVPLEINLISFAVVENNEKVELNWVTASEKNNDYFTIERSKDALTWEELGRVSGMGTTSQSTKYNFNDEHPLLGISYYRLKQTNYNGHSKTFNVELVQINQKAELYMVNTDSREVAFYANIEKEDVAMVEIYNTLGERVARQSMEFEKGSKIYEMTNLQNLTEGVYILQIKTANGLAKSLKFKF